MEPELATQLRLAAFEHLEGQSRSNGTVMAYRDLMAGFHFRGERIPLLLPRGIYIPAFFRKNGLPETALTFNTAAPKPGKLRPYEDGWDSSGILHYKYFQTDHAHRDNVGMRLAMRDKLPLAYFEGISEGQYIAYWPVFLVGENPDDHTFFGATEASSRMGATARVPAQMQHEIIREYSTAERRIREHQRTFRARVLMAYDESCAICRLAHRELLEAAHILPDSDPRGEPWVRNGMALCKIHHAAYDSSLIGIRPDLVVEVREDIRREKDGPMLVHGLQHWHGKPIQVVPQADEWRPSREFLDARYQQFVRAS